ncbi:MAG: hypothetical protein ACP5GZ_07005 [Vulcanisaeta sp.]|jgi:hypothetical protein|uniref:hypothetical protein n=1 Tax=Vulcanisaeta sp. TaxID=2020871 RepID=UPI003D0CCBAD
MPALTTGTIVLRRVKGNDYVYIYVGNVEALKKLKGKKVCLLILEDCATPP